MGVLTESIAAGNGPPDLAAEQAIRDLWAAVERVNAAGYVVTGELCFVLPNKPGMVEVRGFGRTGPVNRLDVRAVGLRSAVSQDLRPMETLMPVAVAEAVVVAAGIVSGTYTGETCAYCHGCRMRRAGTCAVCEDCGATGGCS